MVDKPGAAAQAGQASSAPGATGMDWKFSQVFGERTPGEEVQEGTTKPPLFPESGAGIQNTPPQPNTPP
jgi:hypothetical protein